MKASYALSLLALVTLALAHPNPLPASDSPERTQKCCPPDSDGKCADGTLGTPSCAYGQCNIFNCNCEGGCRSA
ncbi:hypothetical protein BDV27DRAFT_153149 [Aspergillus caelatus]|uniref:Uncharacterized protein n=1 Tax=Aspergillus caelatus TaxID=61420 RepID=A0A5N7AJT3_9EURO|nr:uncharacterized protein BDV27DRAFT_153149 [Aspergillus caelatus]KAE8369269.1 hypothetical protein BDV27DRAFT_153149 [Aspergillus caelatus]